MDPHTATHTLQIPLTDYPCVVIAGGGFAGLELIQQLKGEPLQVVLLDRNNYFTFQPLLYQVATSGLEANSVAYPFRRITRRAENVSFRMAEVERVDPDDKVVQTSIGRLPYDYLVLATGSKPVYFGLDEERLLPLKSVPHALEMRNFLLAKFEEALEANGDGEKRALMNIVVVGGGPTGVELAGALGEMKQHVLAKDYPELDFDCTQIFLLEGEERLLPAMSEASGEKARAFLEELGVTIKLRALVEDYDGEKVHFGDESIVTKNLIWTAGVQAAPPEGLSDADFSKGNRLQVDRHSRAGAYRDIFAVGDLATMSTEAYPHGHPMLAPVAIQQAKRLAKNLVRISQGQDPEPFIYNDKGAMATVGRNRAVVDLPNFSFQGALAWFVWMLVHLMSLVGFRNRAVVLVNWMYNYFTYDRALRLIIGREKEAEEITTA